MSGPITRGNRDWACGPDYVTPKVRRRFWSKVEPGADGCWQWVGTIGADGYGSFHAAMQNGKGVSLKAHRWAWLTMRSELGQLALDHLCRNRACVNPDHLEPVTDKVNAERGAWALRTHCPQGHPFSDGNTVRRKRSQTVDSRECITCRREQATARQHANREELKRDSSLAPHGTLNGYNTWMCRCDECRAAINAYHRERRARHIGRVA